MHTVRQIVKTLTIGQALEKIHENFCKHYYPLHACCDSLL